MSTDYYWIDQTTAKEVAELRTEFQDALEIYKDAEKELEEEHEILVEIGEMINDLEVFEEDLQAIIENKELNLGKSDADRLENMHLAILQVEGKIKDIKQKIKGFKEDEEKDVKKSNIMESKVLKVEEAVGKIKGLMKF